MAVIYLGNNDNQAKKVNKVYIGVDGKAKSVQKAYIGISSKAKLFYENDGKVDTIKLNKISRQVTYISHFSPKEFQQRTELSGTYIDNYGKYAYLYKYDDFEWRIAILNQIKFVFFNENISKFFITSEFVRNEAHFHGNFIPRFDYVENMQKFVYNDELYGPEFNKIRNCNNIKNMYQAFYNCYYGRGQTYDFTFRPLKAPNAINMVQTYYNANVYGEAYIGSKTTNAVEAYYVAGSIINFRPEYSELYFNSLHVYSPINLYNCFVGSTINRGDLYVHGDISKENLNYIFVGRKGTGEINLHLPFSKQDYIKSGGLYIANYYEKWKDLGQGTYELIYSGSKTYNVFVKFDIDE